MVPFVRLRVNYQLTMSGFFCLKTTYPLVLSVSKYELILGHALLELALIALLFLGLSPLLKNNTVTAFISIAGGIILLWLAYGMFRSLPGLSLIHEAKPMHGGNRRLVAAGILVSLANPYWIIWWVTIGLA
jgi:threonine/homoserine/homoserine lactone efflux protein